MVLNQTGHLMCLVSQSASFWGPYNSPRTLMTESDLILFADDCICYRNIKEIEDTVKLQKCIDRLGIWARKWGTKFQTVKC